MKLSEVLQSKEVAYKKEESIEVYWEKKNQDVA